MQAIALAKYNLDLPKIPRPSPNGLIDKVPPSPVYFPHYLWKACRPVDVPGSEQSVPLSGRTTATGVLVPATYIEVTRQN